MSRREEFDDALADLLAEQTTGDDERWPIIGYVVMVMTTDPETMTLEELEIITAENQRDFITRGLVEHGRDTLKADSTAMVSYYTTEDGDDD